MNVVWTAEAEDSFSQNLIYLEQEWNQTVIKNFIDKTIEAIASIENYLRLYPFVSKKKTYDVVLLFLRCPCFIE